jgi:RNA polymerase sigma factor (sigma-70 family)
MSLREQQPSSSHSILDWLNDPEIRRRTMAVAESLVRRYELSPITGEDLYQRSVIKLLRYFHVGRAPQIEFPVGYMFTVLKREAYDLAAKDTAHQWISVEEVPEAKLSDRFDMVQRIERGILLREVLDVLDNDQERELLTDVLNGLTSRQLARKLGVSHVTAAHRWRELKKKIRQAVLR